MSVTSAHSSGDVNPSLILAEGQNIHRGSVLTPDRTFGNSEIREIHENNEIREIRDNSEIRENRDNSENREIHENSENRDSSEIREKNQNSENREIIEDNQRVEARPCSDEPRPCSDITTLGNDRRVDTKLHSVQIYNQSYIGDETNIRNNTYGDQNPHSVQILNEIYHRDPNNIQNNPCGDQSLCNDRTNSPGEENKINNQAILTSNEHKQGEKATLYVVNEDHLIDGNTQLGNGSQYNSETPEVDKRSQSNNVPRDSARRVNHLDNQNESNSDPMRSSSNINQRFEQPSRSRTPEPSNRDFVQPSTTNAQFIQPKHSSLQSKSGSGQPKSSSGQPKSSSGQPKPSKSPQPTQVLIVERTTGEKEVYILDDGKDSSESDNVFEDKVERKKFLIKCYAIVTLDMLFMFTVMACVTFIPDAMEFVAETALIPLTVISGILLIISCVLMCCFATEITSSPWSWVLNIAVVLGFTISTTILSSHYSQDNVAIAVATTLGVVLVLTAIAFLTPFDFTGWLPYMLAILIVFAISGVVLPFVVSGADFKTLDFAMSIVGALLFSVYILIDTQMLMAGKRYSLTTDMYVFGATMLFIDIVHLLIYILRALGKNF